MPLMQVIPTTSLDPSNIAVELQGKDCGNPGISLILVDAAPAGDRHSTVTSTPRS